MTGHREELAVAVRRVNAARSSLPENLRPPFDERRWRRLIDRLDRCRTEHTALQAVEEWEQDTLAPIMARKLNAPLEVSR